MGFFEFIQGIFGNTTLVSNPVMGMALILGIIIGLRIIVRLVSATLKLASVGLGVLLILWILSGMV